MVSSGDEYIGSAKLNTIITGSGATATKVVSDILTSTLLTTLTSTNGIPDGPNFFNKSTAIHVNDTFFSGTNAHFDDIHYNFTAAVPEPMTLMGIGLAAFGARRRFA
jgi:hypothetical protein